VLLAALLLVGTAANARAASSFGAGARAIYWFPDLHARVQTFEAGVAGTEIDVKDDLGVQEENFPGGEAFLRIGRVTLRVGYLPLSFDGSRRLTDDIVFHGTRFTVSDNVVSKLDAKMVDGEIQVDILRPDLGVADLTLGLLLRVKYVDGEVELRGQAAGTERKDFRAPLPMAGLAAGVGLLKGMVRFDARAAGVGYSGNHLIEGDGAVSFAPLPFVRIQGGYRFIDLKIDEQDDIVARLKLKGPYAGFGIAF